MRKTIPSHNDQVSATLEQQASKYLRSIVSEAPSVVSNVQDNDVEQITKNFPNLFYGCRISSYVAIDSLNDCGCHGLSL